MEEQLTVDGYTFSEEEMYKKAKKEKQAVDYLKEQVDYEKPNAVLAIYSQLIKQDVFHTPVGTGFLAEMQKFLVENEEIQNESIPDMPNQTVMNPKVVLPEMKVVLPEKSNADTVRKNEDKPAAKKKEKKAVKEKDTSKYKSRFFYSLFINFALVIVIIIMFVLTLTSDSPNILNYKTKIEDEYATWEQDLTNRQRALDEWESDLNKRQQEADDNE